MRFRSSLLTVGAGLGIPLAAHAATVVNFHDAYNYAGGTSGPGYVPPLYNSIVYSGQGAFADPGNNVWNGFGGGFPGFENNGYRLSALNGPNKTSNGGATPITFEAHYGFDNGGLPNFANGSGGNTIQGTPGFLMGNEAGSNGTNSTGTYTLHHVPAGVYSLYLYGGNYDNDRGTLFAMGALNGGVPHNGINSTLNDHSAPGAALSFVEGHNFVIFNSVAPDANGNITGTFAPNPLDGVGNNNLPGEASFNGLQLIAVPEPTGMGLLAMAAAGALSKRRARRASSSAPDRSLVTERPHEGLELT